MMGSQGMKRVIIEIPKTWRSTEGKFDLTKNCEVIRKTKKMERQRRPAETPENIDQTRIATDAMQEASAPEDLRPVSPEGPPPYLPQAEDSTERAARLEAAWAGGMGRWSPRSGLTGTFPVADRYSITRCDPAEWRARNERVLEAAATRRRNFGAVLEAATAEIDETQTATDAARRRNTDRLNCRRADILRLKTDLELAAAAVAEETGLLEEQRRRLKRAAAVLLVPESVTTECLDRRTDRSDTELIRDEVEEALAEEAALCSDVRRTFAKCLEDLEKQSADNRTASRMVQTDWSGKRGALDIDTECSMLDLRSGTLMRCPVTTFSEDQSTPDYWERFTRETIAEAESTTRRSVALRATLDDTLGNAARDLRTQADKVDAALRETARRTEEALKGLERELKITLREIARAEELVQSLRECMGRLEGPAKVVQTRLERRRHRHGVDNCMDDTQDGLHAEIATVEGHASVLRGRLSEVQKSLRELVEGKGALQREILLKRKSLEIDGDRLPRIRAGFPSAVAMSGY
ncbi:tektin-3 [Cylas formicarius]|uniref:tektin-3 n=1 Tax=Cylas formicarius TaxID=197179 RepID=UPI00295863A6|nr:tektin-3 [Cylas formicarius]